jgi:hypothetical protein
VTGTVGRACLEEREKPFRGPLEEGERVMAKNEFDQAAGVQRAVPELT